jgi:opacity protein-like surface antigen
MIPIQSKTIGVLICMAVCVNKITAQQKLKGVEAGINISTFIYQGDLAPQRVGSLKTPGPGLNLYASKPLRNNIYLRLNFTLGKLKGDDAKYSNPSWRQLRNFNFKSTVAELTGNVVWYPLGNNDYTTGRRLVPYVSGGAGLALLRIKRDWSQLNTEAFSGQQNFFDGLSADQAHRLPRVTPVIPIGAGISYSLSQKISVVTEASYRFLFTDYLDGFSQSANPARKDSYYSISAGIKYSFGKNHGIDCPRIRF